MPQLVYPTRPRTSNACKKKEVEACLPVHSLLSDSHWKPSNYYRKCYSGNLSSVLSLVHTLDLSIVILYDEWLIEFLVCQWEKLWSRTPLAKSEPGGPAKPGAKILLNSFTADSKHPKQRPKKVQLALRVRCEDQLRTLPSDSYRFARAETV